MSRYQAYYLVDDSISLLAGLGSGPSPKMQIIITLGQSLSVGSTTFPQVLSSTPRFPEHALTLDFGVSGRLASGWRSTPVDPSKFLGFAPIREVGRETHVSGMIDTVIDRHIQAGQTPPVFLHINGGEGGRNILQLMTSQSDVFQNYQEALLATQPGDVFALSRSDGLFDMYFRNLSDATFQRTVSGPLVYFDNVVKQLELAVDHARSTGYELATKLVFNWIQGQSDNSSLYDSFLAELISKLDAAADAVFGQDVSVSTFMSQIRGSGSKTIPIEQISFINDQVNVVFGAAEYAFNARFPSSSTDLTHISSEGYFMMGQRIGHNIFDLLSGNENKPILIEKIEQISPRSLVVHFSGVDNYLVDDPLLYSAAGLLRAPDNFGFGVYRTNGGLLSGFAIQSATIIGPASVRLDFTADLVGDFRLYLGRTEDALSIVTEGGHAGFGGTSLRDAGSRNSLATGSGFPLSDPNLYEHVPIQFVTLKAVVFPPPPPPPAAPPPLAPTVVVFGTSANDTVIGTSADEVIFGISASATDMGLRQIDWLTGGDGYDLFVLGDERGAFYNRNQADSMGVSEYAVITDFSGSDRIQLAAGGTYFLAPGKTKLASGTGIYLDKNGDGVRDGLDELIAIVQGPKIPTMADVIFSDQPEAHVPLPQAPPPPPPPAAPPPPAPTVVVFGTSANDTVIGTSADEVIFGISASATDMGLRQIDWLTGGDGYDLFVLGDDRGAFYNRNQANSSGVSEYAVITDFSGSDRIQLAAGGTYFLTPAKTKLASGTGIYLDKNGDGVRDSLDELIAIVQGPKIPIMADVIFSGQPGAYVPPSPSTAPLLGVAFEATQLPGVFAPSGFIDVLFG